MKRKDYERPTMQVVKLQQRTHLLQASVQSETIGTQNYTTHDYEEE